MCNACLPLQNGQCCCSAAEQLQEALQNHCEVAGCGSHKFWLLNAAKSSHLTALNSDLTVAETFSEITISAAEKL